MTSHRLVTILAILLFAILIGYAVFEHEDLRQYLRSFFSASHEQAYADPPPLAPSLSEQELQAIATGRGFDVLISYTNRGFEPADTDTEIGSVVRFTNNSTRGLRVSESTSVPVVSDCEGLDSCTVLDPGEFWEFEFTEPGVITYRNALRAIDEASINVQ
ncbi:MAG TPA: hypothetical protein VJH91_00855 [Candidatus Paceibacterota bacterium]